MSDRPERSTDRPDPRDPFDPDEYATATRAVQLMGGEVGPRAVQKWMAAAGVHPRGNYGYPIADLVRVINARDWPRKRPLHAEHFRLRVVRPNPSERSTDRPDGAKQPPAAALAVVPPLLAALAALAERSLALSDQAERLAAAQAELAAALERERTERSAERRATAERLEALAADLAALRARPWWAFWRRGG